MTGTLEPLRPEPVPPAGLLPDRVAIWPMEDGRFGIDATFQGVTGFQRAERHEQALRDRDVRCDFRQDSTAAGPSASAPSRARWSSRRCECSSAVTDARPPARRT